MKRTAACSRSQGMTAGYGQSQPNKCLLAKLCMHARPLGGMLLSMFRLGCCGLVCHISSCISMCPLATHARTRRACTFHSHRCRHRHKPRHGHVTYSMACPPPFLLLCVAAGVLWQEYTYPCPCGDEFRITHSQLMAGQRLAPCPSCTLHIRIKATGVNIERVHVCWIAWRGEVTRFDNLFLWRQMRCSSS